MALLSDTDEHDDVDGNDCGDDADADSEVDASDGEDADVDPWPYLPSISPPSLSWLLSPPCCALAWRVEYALIRPTPA